MYGASCRVVLMRGEALGDNNEECSDWARKSTQHDLMYGFLTRLCLPGHIFLDKISTPSLHRSLDRKCGRLWEKLHLSFCLCEDGNCSYCLCRTNSEFCTDGDAMPYYSDHALLFWFCYSDSLIEIVCKSSIQRLHWSLKIPSVGGRLIISS